MYINNSDSRLLWSITNSMRNIIFILFIFTACSKPSKQDFLGAWFYCDYTGQYSELHIANDQVIFNFNAPNGWYSPHPFEIINDTLVYLDTLHNWKDSQGNPIVVKNRLIVSNDELTFLYGITDSIKYKWTFNRFKNEIKNHQKDSSLSKSEFMDLRFYERSKLINCSDQRTNEEIEQDSIRIYEQIKDIL
jgi:hypothetical protein